MPGQISSEFLVDLLGAGCHRVILACKLVRDSSVQL